MIKIEFTHKGEELLTVKVDDTAFYIPNIGERVIINNAGYKVVEKNHYFYYEKEDYPQTIVIVCV